MNKFKPAVWGITMEIGQWVLWYLPIMIIIMLGIVIFVDDPSMQESSFLEMVMTSNRVYMLVVGILSTFLYFEWMFKMGVTRKMYMKVMSLTIVIIALIVNVLTLLFTYIFALIPWLKWFTLDNVSIELFLLSVAVSIAGAFIGSVIGAGFYRSTKIGFLTILFALLMAGVEILAAAYQWEGGIFHWIILLILTAAAYMLNYKIVHRIPVKL